MHLGQKIYALFAKKADAKEDHFDLRLRAMGSPVPLRHRRALSPFKNQPSRQAA